MSRPVLNSYDAYLYAKDIIKGSWPAGEDIIAKDMRCSYWYARHVVKGKWLLGEKSIHMSKEYSSMYDTLCKID
jgi:hypothetical protein